MEIIKNVTNYKVKDFVSGEHKQEIRFISKEYSDNESKVIQDGTTTEELLEVLIHRTTSLLAKKPDFYTREVLGYLNMAKITMKQRQYQKSK